MGGECSWGLSALGLGMRQVVGRKDSGVFWQVWA